MFQIKHKIKLQEGIKTIREMNKYIKAKRLTYRVSLLVLPTRISYIIYWLFELKIWSLLIPCNTCIVKSKLNIVFFFNVCSERTDKISVYIYVTCIHLVRLHHAWSLTTVIWQRVPWREITIWNKVQPILSLMKIQNI